MSGHGGRRRGSGRKPLPEHLRQRCAALRAQNLTMPEIARRLGIATSTVWRVLKQ